MRRRKDDERGVVLIEFALIVGLVFVPLVIGGLDIALSMMGTQQFQSQSSSYTQFVGNGETFSDVDPQNWPSGPQDADCVTLMSYQVQQYDSTATAAQVKDTADAVCSFLTFVGAPVGTKGDFNVGTSVTTLPMSTTPVDSTYSVQVAIVCTLNGSQGPCDLPDTEVTICARAPLSSTTGILTPLYNSTHYATVARDEYLVSPDITYPDVVPFTSTAAPGEPQLVCTPNPNFAAPTTTSTTNPGGP